MFFIVLYRKCFASKNIGAKNGYYIDLRQELPALGIANAAVDLGQGYPVAAGLSQSAVNDSTGAKTPL